MQRNYLTMAATSFAIMCLLLLTAQSMAFRTSAIDQLNLLVDIRQELAENFVEPVDEQKMVEEAVRGMVESLEDPYTVFIKQDDIDEFDKSIRGTFSGIGAEIEIRDNRLRIASPLEDSPAWKSGVLAGDIVLEIDGKPVSELFADLKTDAEKSREAIKHLTGEEGTVVKIRVRHESGEESEIAITRARIEIPVIKGVRRRGDGHWDFMLDPANKIGYIRLTQFTQRSVDDLRAALRQLKQENVRGLILDLRFDPGGLLPAAVQVADMFLPAGNRIVSVKGRNVPEHIETSTAEATLTDVPMVVLANEFSASASEIVTGALADNNRAKFIGTRTFGKGSVQTVKMIQNDSGQPLGILKMTNAYYYLPSGRNIHRVEGADVWGVDPDEGFYVPMNAEQIRKMIEARRESDVLRPDNGNNGAVTVTPLWIEEQLHDPQLAAGLKALIGKLDQGDWPRVGQSNVQQQVESTRRENLVRQRDLIRDSLREVEAELAKLGVDTATLEDSDTADEEAAEPAAVE